MRSAEQLHDLFCTIRVLHILCCADKSRGYGLIGKMLILHIFVSGSSPDISIYSLIYASNLLCILKMLSIVICIYIYKCVGTAL